MDSKLRGRLQALLAATPLQSQLNSIDVSSVDKELKAFNERLNQHMEGNSQLTNHLQQSKNEIERLQQELGAVQASFDGEKKKVSELEKECGRLKSLQGRLEEVTRALAQAELQRESYKADVMEAERTVQMREETIQAVNMKLADRDCQISTLQDIIKQQKVELEEQKQQLTTEQSKSTELETSLNQLKANHKEQLSSLKLEMGEKVMRAQAKLTQQCAGMSAPTAAGALSVADVTDIYKKKLAHTENKYQKELADLKRMVNRLQQRK